MRTLITILSLTTLFLFVACDDDDDTNNTNNSNNTNNTNNVNNTNNTNNVNNTNALPLVFNDSGCKLTGDGVKALSDFSTSGFECVYWDYDGVSELHIMHVNTVYNCCPDETLGMTGEATLDGSTLTITGSDNGGLCNCVCPYDLSYDISGVAPGSYEISATPLEGPIMLDLESAGEGIYCEDYLTDYTHCEGAGERGSFCQDSTECMNGDGHCLEVGTSGSYCVDSCNSSEECPMPDLESCTGDATDIGYCDPVTL